MTEAKLSAALAEIAKDAFAALSENPESNGPARLSPSARVSDIAVEDAKAEAFLKAVADDPVLSPFSTADIGLFLTASTGLGMRIQAQFIASALIRSAAGEVADTSADLEQFLTLVEDHLWRFRRLVAGEPAEGISVIGFHGFALPEGARVETPWGVLRPATGDHGLRTGATPSVVLETRVPIRMLVEEDPSNGIRAP